MARTRHVVVGGGTAGLNAVTTIRQYDRGQSEIYWVSNEEPYARMVLPYYLKGSISETHCYTARPSRLMELGVEPFFGHRAVKLDTQANVLTLDDETEMTYDDILIATGSSAVRAPVPGADSEGVHSFWTLEQAKGVIRSVSEGSHVVMVGAGFIAFTILNSIIARGAKLTVVEIAPQILPRMIDQQGAALVERWLVDRGVDIRTSAQLSNISDSDGQKRLSFQDGEDLLADCVIMATGIRTNLGWLEGSGVEINQGILVDDHLRSNVPNVYAAGDVAEGRDLITGQAAVHAIEPTAMEHGRVAGANMAGQPQAYRGSLLMNIVEVLDLEIASFGAWNAEGAEVFSAVHEDRPAYRKLVWDGDRMIGAMILGRANDVWATNDVGMLKGLVQSGTPMGDWKGYLKNHLFEVKRAYMASGTTARLLPVTVQGRASVPASEITV
ncbi:NAD(P)/FAD-dependent oxidoreductase [Candidatus Entotheonella palauensis]|nr:FAD-dependent oxidoreductase [Candidatus Entotheonella palauensis]